MKVRSLGVIALGLACTSAMAQSVTIYGIADAYWGSAVASGKTTQRVINSGGLSTSRLGFRGTEDLGGNWKALFTLEYALAIDGNTGIGTGTSAARQQLVGLSGPYGALFAGRIQHAGYDWAQRVDPFAGSAIDPLLTLQRNFGNAKTRGTALGVGSLFSTSSRLSNALAYQTPAWGGVTLALNHGRITEDENANPGLADAYANLASITYGQGTLTLSGVYAYADFSGTAGATPAAMTRMAEWAVGGNYDFKVLKLFASYQRQNVRIVGARYGDDALWQAAVTVPVFGAGSVLFSIAANKIHSTAAGDDSKSYALAYTHALSKRTTLYAGLQRVTNDPAAALGASNTFLAPSVGGSGSMVVIGARHNF